MVSTTATVRRVGAGERQIPSEELVVGDIVTLSVGDIVPADCKLLESRDLRIAQGALTGESMPVRKDAAALLAAGARDTALTDAACLVFMGTTVISGSALAVVIATGRSALFGGLSRAFQWQRPPLPVARMAGAHGPLRPGAADGRQRAPPRTTPPRVGFFGRMRTESVHPGHREERTRDETLAPVGDCIRRHDHKRIKRSLGWMSPVQYRQSQGTAA